jgi:sucrose-6-phosphate hydrolase SacC (GH32 family)
MMKKIFRIAMVLMLLAMLIPAMTAGAALPTDMSWVKYGSNPVVPKGTCGIAQPSQPALLVESTDNYKMYFTTHPGTAGAQIYLATTSDGGLTWSCYSTTPVLTKGTSGAWDADRVISPTVVKDGDSDYKMWYAGRSSSAIFAIGYATSTDGISWTKNTNPVFTVGAPGEWDSSIVREPSVVNVSGTYHLFYSGTDKWPYFHIGHATSGDGITWSKDGANPVLSPTAGSPAGVG